MLQRTVPAAAWLALLLALAAVLRVAGQPLELLQASLPEAAAQTLAAARQLASGHGLSLDGLHPTSGLPLLPTALAAGLVALVHDPATQLRGLVALGGLLWLVAGWLLWQRFPRWPLAGLGALLVWLAMGFDGQVALRGTDAGLAAALLAWLLAAGHRFAAVQADAPTWRRRAGELGTAAGMLALTRAEFLALGMLLHVWVLVRARGASSLWRAIARSLAYALPVGLAAAAWLATNRWAGGSWLPVDLLLAMHRDPWTFDFDAQLAAAPGFLLAQAEHTLPSAFATARAHLVPVLGAAPEVFWWSCLGATLALPLLPRLCSWLRCRPGTLAAALPLYLALALFVVAELACVLWQGQLGANHGASQLAGDRIAVWFCVALTLGGLLGPTRRWWQVALGLPLAAALVGSSALRVAPWFAAPAPAHAAAFELGAWLDRLPPGQRIGADQPGAFALAAPSQAFCDLSGAANHAAYLRQWLLPGKVADYCREQRLVAFAAVLPLAAWQERLATLPQPVRPLQCALAADGRIAAALALPDSTLPAHPLAAIAFRALVLGELPTQPAAPASQLPAEQRAVAGLFDPVVGGLRVVTMPTADAAAAIVAADLAPLALHPSAALGPFELLAAELEPRRVADGNRLLVRVYLRARATNAGAAELVLEVGTPGDARQRTCREPLAFGSWSQGLPEGGLVAHTFWLDLGELPAGHHTVQIGWQTAQPEAGTNAPEGKGSVRLGTVRIP